MFNKLVSDTKRELLTCNFNAFSNRIHVKRETPGFHVLIYMLEGEWEIWQDGIAYTAKKGDLLCFHADKTHYGITPCSENVKTMYLHITPSLGDDFAPATDKTEQFYYFPVLHNYQSSQIPSYIENLILTYWSMDLYKQQKMSAKLDLLLSEMSAEIVGEPTHPVIRAATEMISQNPSRFFTITELANHFNISNKTMTSLFRQYTGQTIHRYQFDQKLMMAQNLIHIEPGITLKELAASFGFYDEYHFCKCYKTKFGISPKRKIGPKPAE